MPNESLIQITIILNLLIFNSVISKHELLSRDYVMEMFLLANRPTNRLTFLGYLYVM